MARVMSAGVSEEERGDGGGVVLNLAVSCITGAGEVGGGGGVVPASDPGTILGLPRLRFGVPSAVVVGVVMRVCWWSL